MNDQLQSALMAASNLSAALQDLEAAAVIKQRLQAAKTTMKFEDLPSDVHADIEHERRSGPAMIAWIAATGLIVVAACLWLITRH